MAVFDSIPDFGTKLDFLRYVEDRQDDVVIRGIQKNWNFLLDCLINPVFVKPANDTRRCLPVPAPTYLIHRQQVRTVPRQNPGRWW